MFFEAIDPLVFISPFLKDREEGHSLFLQIASVVYVNVMSRIGGLFVVRNQDTNWSNIRTDAMNKLFDQGTEKSLGVARQVVNHILSTKVMCEIKEWGIQVLVWRLGRIAYPDRA